MRFGAQLPQKNCFGMEVNMEDITEVKDIVQIILQTDEIERDGSIGYFKEPRRYRLFCKSI